MDKNTAVIIVKVYAVLAWIGAVFTAIGSLGMLFWGSVVGGLVAGYGSLFAGLGIVFAVILLVVAALEAIAGFGLWQHKRWARILAIIMSILSLFAFPIGTIIGAIGIYLFGFEKAIKQLF